MENTGKVVPPRSVERVLNILDCVATSRAGRSLAALSKEIVVPKSSLLNLVRALVGSGHLDLNDGIYTLGRESYALSMRIRAAQQPSQLLHHMLERLYAQTDETVIIGMHASEDQVAYIDKIEPKHSVRAHVMIGQRRPLYSSAGGRAILAHWPKDKLDAYLKRAKLVKATPMTVTKVGELREILAEVAVRGYAVTVSEAEMGLGGVAAPIFKSNGEVVGSVIISCPTSRMESRVEEFGKLAGEASRDISRFDEIDGIIPNWI